MEKYNLSFTELNETQNHEDFNIIWLSLDAVPNSISDNYLKQFDCREACISYIRKFKSERKFLLVLTMDLEYLSSFEDLSQIQSIYILKKSNENIQFNKQNCLKLVDKFENIDELINRLRKDILLLYTSDLPVNISSLNENNIEESLISLHRNSLTILWYKSFIYHLIQSSNVNMEELKQIMLDQCRLEYQNSENELIKINSFNMYCSNENILNWYTQDSFLYRLLNKAFRTRNIHFICRFQYFLKGVYKKFQELSEIQQETYPLIVYRGQILNTNDLKRLQSNVDPLILMNTFVSTTRNEEIAHLFIRGARLSALFKINIHNRFQSYIDISSFSSMPYEQEILFFPGTIFSIDSIQQENDSTWIIELTLNNEISEHIENLISDFQNHIPVFKNKHNLFMKTDDFRLIKQYYKILTGEEFCLNNESLNMIYIYVAFTFSNLGCYEKAIELYKKYLLIGNISIDSSKSKVIHMIIGYLYYNFSAYDSAFLHYGIVLSLLDEGNLLTLELYNHIGDVWNTIDNIDYAISCYQQALNVGNINNICRSDINQKLNDLLLKKKHSAPNYIYQRQINDIDEHYRSIINPDNETELKDCQCQLNNEHNLTPIQHIDVLYRFGICLMRKGDFCYALEIFLKTKQMVIDQPPDDENNSISIWFIDLSYQIGLCWMKKGDFDQALKNLLTAEQIIIKNPPLWDRFPQLLATLYDNITILYFFLNEPFKALIMWKKSNDIKTNFSYD
ncbi:unnamed protein product [Adineta steineri]|uniref:NAD(P)(+)--arginine ADP-ribosyltransferase n=2 Tax=Adineta steineri TaxID=433720 RepID=A0A814Y0B8_9BILA|nr:unnamed protein product [Adineta steineri]CAF4062718.1 unnamed protein product [Adineta steineri]